MATGHHLHPDKDHIDETQRRLFKRHTSASRGKKNLFLSEEKKADDGDDGPGFDMESWVRDVIISKHDPEHKGKLDLDGFLKACAELGISVDRKEAEKVFNYVAQLGDDADTDSVDVKEMVQFIRSDANDHLEVAHLQKAFRKGASIRIAALQALADEEDGDDDEDELFDNNRPVESCSFDGCVVL